MKILRFLPYHGKPSKFGSPFDIRLPLTWNHAARTADKRSLVAWSPVIPGADRRGAPGFVSAVTALVLDLDLEVADPLAAWTSWHACAHTTWSAAIAARGGWRVIVPLARPLPAPLYSRLWRWGIEREPRADRQCSDADRIWFWPTKPSEPVDGGRAEMLVHAGPLLDWTEIIRAENVPEPVRPPSDASNRAPSSERHTTPVSRRALALRVDARLAGSGSKQRAEDGPCPACGDRSVWFWVDPWNAAAPGTAPALWARCAHKQTCGWYGPLDALGA